MNLEKLTEPFPPEYIKQREGRKGKMLDYVEAHKVVQRLNEAFAGLWNFQVLEHERTDTEVIVLGELSAEGVTKQQFGTSEITFAKGTQELVCLGDDYKAAASDSLKKCAAMLGVALYLYEENKKAQKPAGKQKGASNGRVAEQQKKAIVNLLKQLGVGEEQVEGHLKEHYGCALDDLSYEQRAGLIRELSAEANGKQKEPVSA
jgi:hypothetical protein